MRILFTTGNTYLPQSTGGAQSSTEQLVKRVQARGHVAAVACNLYGGDRVSFSARIKMKAHRRRFARDRYHGYDVYRAWRPVDQIVAIARTFAADVVVVQHQDTVPIARELQAAGMPIAVYLRNVEFKELGGSLSELSPDTQFIANSRFTADRYADHFAIAPYVIPPLVEKGRYSVLSSGENVTFINPMRVKGVDIALEVAGLCPEIPFVFIESWPIPPEEKRNLLASLAALPNVSFRARTDDMRSVYDKARAILAPSQWEEAWGRVATEAHMSGIPVVGSKRGGLPEAIGPGGVLIDADAPAQRWADAIRKLWSDDLHYGRISKAARVFADREDIDPDAQTEKLLRILDTAIAGRRTAETRSATSARNAI